MDSRIFNVRCPKCNRYMRPYMIIGSDDRIKFCCLNENCKKVRPIIKFLSRDKKLKKNYERWIGEIDKKESKMMILDKWFRMAALCYSDCVEKDPNCKKCHRGQKKMCREIDNLAGKLCYRPIWGYERK